MKRWVCLCLITLAPLAVCRGQATNTNQTVVASMGPPATLEQAPPLTAPGTNQVPYFIRKRATYQGTVPRASRSKNRWQMINPFAPASHGSGWDNVAVDPNTGRAAGVAVFSIRF